MVRIRPRQPATVAGRPLEGEHVPPPEELDELAGAEAFGAREDVDPDDPFGAGDRRRREPGRDRAASAGLVVAAILLAVGGLSLVLGLADDDDDVRSDDVATDTTTSTTTEFLSTSSTTAPSVASTTSTTSGFAPGATPTTVARPTVTTLRPSTTLPTTTTLPPNRPMDVTVTVLVGGVEGAEITQGTPVEISVSRSDPDSQPLSSDCLRVVVEGGPDDEVIADDTCDSACPSPTVVQPEGGTRTSVIPYTFTEDGPHTIVVSATSGRPGCGNPYADRIVNDRTSVDVDAAS